MKQTELIEKIKYALGRVHKKIGVFQVGELDEIFGEPEKEETALEFIGKAEEEKKVNNQVVHKQPESEIRDCELGDVPLIKEAIEPKGDDTK